MTPERSVREIASEWNARAKAEGRLLVENPWEQSTEGESIFNVPLTPEAQERIMKLDAIIKGSKTEETAKVNEALIDTRTGIGNIIDLQPVHMPLEGVEG